ncbi:aquaporin-11 [Pseudophryne corroboree]|uniref:aquaporin-11 n=1 Tax=Pseudophryne corroboree TaxID=495146 RepID=UPI003081FFA1
MHLVLGSVALVGCALLICELLRWLSRRYLPSGQGQELALEAVGMLQMGCCTREMILLGSLGGLDTWLALTLTYLQVVLHCLTSRGATCNPCGSAQQWLCGRAPGAQTALRVGAQFAGAALSWVLMPRLWLLGLSPLHGVAGQCSNPMRVALVPGALVEMTCTLCLYLILHFLPQVKAQQQPQVVALTITGIVYAGAHLTGAVFNPALAFAVMFMCQGSTLSQYVTVYCIGPLIGMVLSILALERGIPKLGLARKSPKLPKRD